MRLQPSLQNYSNECLIELGGAFDWVSKITVNTLMFLMFNARAIDVIKFHLNANLRLFFLYSRGMVTSQTPCTILGVKMYSKSAATPIKYHGRKMFGRAVNYLEKLNKAILATMI